MGAKHKGASLKLSINMKGACHFNEMTLKGGILLLFHVITNTNKQLTFF